MSNMGVTLPDDGSATHDVGLAPLFIMRAGRNNYTDEDDILLRGRGGFYWSTTVNGRWINGANYLWVGNNYTYPMDNNTYLFAQSLRCLVSTNNRIMIHTNIFIEYF